MSGFVPNFLNVYEYPVLIYMQYSGIGNCILTSINLILFKKTVFCTLILFKTDDIILLITIYFLLFKLLLLYNT